MQNSRGCGPAAGPRNTTSSAALLVVDSRSVVVGIVGTRRHPLPDAPPPPPPVLPLSSLLRSRSPGTDGKSAAFPDATSLCRGVAGARESRSVSWVSAAVNVNTTTAHESPVASAPVSTPWRAARVRRREKRETPGHLHPSPVCSLPSDLYPSSHYHRLCVLPCDRPASRFSFLPSVLSFSPLSPSLSL